MAFISDIAPVLRCEEAYVHLIVAADVFLFFAAICRITLSYALGILKRAFIVILPQVIPGQFEGSRIFTVQNTCNLRNEETRF